MPKAEFLLFPHVLFLSHSHPSWIMLTPFLQSLRTKTGILLTLLFLAQFTRDWSANPTGCAFKIYSEFNYILPALCPTFAQDTIISVPAIWDMSLSQGLCTCCSPHPPEPIGLAHTLTCF